MKDLKDNVIKALNRLETHDRKICFQKNQTDVGSFIQYIVDTLPFGRRPCYVFIVHKRTLGMDERVSLVKEGQYDKIEDTPVAFMDMQVRLSKPGAVPNTTLIKIYPGTDKVRVIWTLPEEHEWPMFGKGKMFEDETTLRSIRDYSKRKKVLEALEPDDPQTKDQFEYLMNQHAKTLEQRKKLVRRIPIYAPRETYVPI